MSTIEVIFEKGGPMTGPLLFCSIVGLSIIFERLMFWAMYKSSINTASCDDIVKSIENSETEKTEEAFKLSKDPIAIVMHEGLKNKDVDPMMSMELASRVAVKKMNNRLSVLDTMIAVAPLLGILGTVLGIIESFGFLGGEGLKNPEDVTGGISEALFSTAGGLVVAIVCLVFLNVFKSMTRRCTYTFEEFMGKVLVALKRAET